MTTTKKFSLTAEEEEILITLDQVEQTIEVMGSVVERLKEQLAQQMRVRDLFDELEEEEYDTEEDDEDDQEDELGSFRRRRTLH